MAVALVLESSQLVISQRIGRPDRDRLAKNSLGLQLAAGSGEQGCLSKQYVVILRLELQRFVREPLGNGDIPVFRMKIYLRNQQIRIFSMFGFHKQLL